MGMGPILLLSQVRNTCLNTIRCASNGTAVERYSLETCVHTCNTQVVAAVSMRQYAGIATRVIREGGNEMGPQSHHLTTSASKKGNRTATTATLDDTAILCKESLTRVLTVIASAGSFPMCHCGLLRLATRQPRTHTGSKHSDIDNWVKNGCSQTCCEAHLPAIGVGCIQQVYVCLKRCCNRAWYSQPFQIHT